MPKAVDPFDRLASKADLSSRKLALLLEAAKDKSATRTAAANAPAPERFAAATDFAGATAPVLLAYADPSPTVGNESVAAVAAMASAGLAEVAGEEQAGEPVDPAAAPGLLPETVPLPGSRPEIDAKTRKLLRAEESPKPAKPQTRLAYARPDNPVEEKPGSGFGRFKNLFGARPKAGKGVAVYDISAKKVYMPDGSVLEAHSGIGKMADDPRYVNVKMNGPTPPHTYNLRMRETRFHGVEAIRMIPVDGKNKYGRDGFLTHSYLLRSRRPESHGCVAFKDYPKFLAAFKKGQVKQLVVVPGSGKGAVRVAKNGRDA